MRYFQDIVDWYRRKVESLRLPVIDTARDIQQSDDIWLGQLSSIRTSCVNGTFHAREQLSWKHASHGFNGEDMPYRIYTNSTDLEESLPERPALGSYLGPFTLLTSWLLRAESLPLP